MAVLTDTVSLEEDIWRKVDESAQREARSRDEVVNDAIDAYIRRKAWEELCEVGREMRESGITEEDVNEAFKEVREERKRRKA